MLTSFKLILWSTNKFPDSLLLHLKNIAFEDAEDLFLSCKVIPGLPFYRKQQAD